MTNTNIYRDIAARTGGDIYIGVVGPVRTGKSTFIKRVFEKLIIPGMPADFARERTIDELPQSSAGRSIMTTEPKFVPESAAKIELCENTTVSVRMVDCVGYIVPSSLGYYEGDSPRMVKTPWFEEDIPFNMAAEIGTKKVITEHSTIGLVITSDGSISDIPRDENEEAEERVIDELKDISKPFIVLLNCMYPKSSEAERLVTYMINKYKVPVIAVNCLEISEDEIKEIMLSVLYEFPVKKITINLPAWFRCLPDENEIKDTVTQAVKENAGSIVNMHSLTDFCEKLGKNGNITDATVVDISLGSGEASLNLRMNDNIYYALISDKADEKLSSEFDIVKVMEKYSVVRKKYDRIAAALKEVDAKGYGIVMPTIDELTLEEPEIVKQGGKYGVRLKASAPSIHMMKAQINTEVAPIVGSEKQSEDLVRYLLDEFEGDPGKIWESNIFGKSLNELVNEGLRNKLMHMPDDARMKLQQTLERIINEGCSGLICIIL